MPDLTTTKPTLNSTTRRFDAELECYASDLLTAGAEVGAVLDLDPAMVNGEIVLKVGVLANGAAGTYAGGTTILLEGSAVVGMTSPVDLATFVFTGDGPTTVTVPFTTKPDQLVDAFQFVRLTVTLAGSDTYTSAAWLTRNKS